MMPNVFLLFYLKRLDNPEINGKPYVANNLKMLSVSFSFPFLNSFLHYISYGVYINHGRFLCFGKIIFFLSNFFFEINKLILCLEDKTVDKKNHISIPLYHIRGLEAVISGLECDF